MSTPTRMKRIGVLTGGGDAPGLNAVIRAVVKAAVNAGVECVGLEDSFDGLIYPERSRPLTLKNVTGILRIGGTILGTTNSGNPFVYPVNTADGPVDYSDRVIENFHKMGLDALVVIGGDGTLSIAHEFHKRGMPIVGVPKTIDNDIVETTMTFGFDTAVAFATRCARPAAHDRRVASPHHGGRGDGPLCGLDRAVRRNRRRCRRRADSGDSVQLRQSRRPHPGARSVRGQVQHRGRGGRRARSGRGAIDCHVGHARPCRAPRGHRRTRVTGDSSA